MKPISKKSVVPPVCVSPLLPIPLIQINAPDAEPASGPVPKRPFQAKRRNPITYLWINVLSAVPALKFAGLTQL
jgi:hypothetical protein